MVSPLSDPWALAQIEAALEPYRGRLPEADLAWMREQLAETLALDPAAARLVRAARPREVDESGEVATDPDAPGEPAARGRRGGGA